MAGGQQDVDGIRVGIEAFAGTKKVDTFHIDLVVGSVMTAGHDERPAPSAVNVLGDPRQLQKGLSALVGS